MSTTLVETAESSEAVFRGHFLAVDRDIVLLPDGTRATREYVRHPGAVVVVPWLAADEQLVLVRQWRHPLRRVFLEFPAGKLDTGESVLDCATRELIEETGYKAGRLAYAGAMHNAIAYSDEVIHIVFATDLIAGPTTPDAGEFVEPTRMQPQEVVAAIFAHQVTDAKTITAMFWFEKVRANAVGLDWTIAMVQSTDQAR